jgi:hypothetical protein
VKGDETEKELERLEKRGFTLVKVVRDIDSQITSEGLLADKKENNETSQ